MTLVEPFPRLCPSVLASRELAATVTGYIRSWDTSIRAASGTLRLRAQSDDAACVGKVRSLPSMHDTDQSEGALRQHSWLRRELVDLSIRPILLPQS